MNGNGFESNSHAAVLGALPSPLDEAGRTRNDTEERRVRNRKRLTLSAMCLATLIAILDTTVVNLALQAIQADLRASLAALQ